MFYKKTFLKNFVQLLKSPLSKVADYRFFSRTSPEECVYLGKITSFMFLSRIEKISTELLSLEVDASQLL